MYCPFHLVAVHVVQQKYFNILYIIDSKHIFSIVLLAGPVWWRVSDDVTGPGRPRLHGYQS